jgi:hypothetical protein
VLLRSGYEGGTMKHVLRRIAACTSAVAVVGAMSVPFMTGNTVATATPRAGASLFRVQMARNFLSHLKIGQPRQIGEVHVASTNRSLDGVTSDDSVNWSGYADTPGTSTYSAVSGSWTQPTVKCPASGIAMAAFWVGIDGFSDDSVEQDGTIVECIYGLEGYADWWEMYPSNSVQFEYDVKPGDSITASVALSGTSYTLAVTDSTHPKDSFTTAQTCAPSSATSTCLDTSAEWVAEAPCCKNAAGTLVYNLADFKTWTMTDAAETYDGTAGNIDSGPTVNEITMVSQKKNGDTKALPGALTAGGTSFSVTWKKAS